MSFTPTTEQTAILDSFGAGESITIQARAGTGKTTTMVAVGNKALDLGKRGYYIVYNTKAKQDAEKKFPKNVTVKTAHGLAYTPIILSKEQKATGLPLQKRLNGPRVTRKDICNILSIHTGMGDQDTFLAATKLAGFVMETVRNFCYSDAQRINKYHVPFVIGTEDYRDEFVEFCVTKAREAWDDLTSNRGRLKFEHDHYLKMFALGDPKLHGDFILLDEAQDANPVMAQIVNNQTHMQRIMVGDSCQSIYAWRGAVDALANFKSDRTLYLSKSFRFGPAVADEANKWLRLLGETVMVEGHEPINSVVEPFDTDPDGTAILCRTNAEVLAQAMQAQDDGRKVAIVGGAQALAAYAEAALDLMAGKGTWHHELLAFKTWQAVQQYCIDEREEAGSLAVMVKMIDSYGPHAILDMAARCGNEDDADVILSTAHKAKGAEWDNVRIGNDFVPTKRKGEDEAKISRPDMMLAYVSVTRAKLHLDRTGLAWVDSYIGEEA
jgi:superfamily I DNA/RNA helicase